MSLLFLESFDKYGPANTVSANVAALLTQGEWTSTTNTVTIVAPLSATGYAVNCGNNSSISKTLAASYSRLIGGFRFSTPLVVSNGIVFNDAGTAQCSISINAAGTISVRNGGLAGTALATSTVSVTANTTHYLEFDISFSNTGTFAVYLDGIAVIGGSSGIGGTGDTTATANNTANAFVLTAGNGGAGITFDDLYLLDATGPAPLNAPLLSSPRIETQFPASDGAVQFAVGAAVLGSSMQRAAGSVTINANQLRVRAVTPAAACTVTAINILAGATGSGSLQLRPVVYGQTAGAPGSLLGSGSVSVGTTANTVKTLPLTSGVALSAGVTYYIGVMNDVSQSNAFAALSSVADDLQGTATFASGAPSTAPATTATSSTVIYGTITTSANWPSVSQNPAQGSLSYVYDATVGHEDLYNFPPLSVVPSAIYATAIKASVSKSDAGAKTVSVRQKSGATDSAGNGGTALAPGTSFAWLTSLYPLDPNGNIAWTKAALDAAQGGIRVES